MCELSGREHPLDVEQALDESIDVVARRVDVE
jgi:hypothetical protein